MTGTTRDGARPSTSSDLRTDIEWRHAVEIGTPPLHRLSHPAFETGSSASGASAAARWRETVSRHAPGRDRTAFGILGVDNPTVDAAFGAVRLVSDVVPPRWLDHLTRTIDAIPDEPLSHDPGADSTEAAGDYFVEAARRLLGWESLAARHPFLGEQSLVAFARHLAVRVVMTCGAVLELENLSQDDVSWDFTRSAWRQRLIGFPALNYVVGVAVCQWHDNSEELIARLGADLDVLTARMFDGRDPGPLTVVEFDLGDRHREGRSVARLGFASGATVVYKPKDPTPAFLFSKIADTVNRAAGFDMVPRFAIIDRGRYCWEEHVGQATASTADEAVAFFTRFGAILRTLQLVEGRDFWVDNLRVAGDRPVFIDLECILQPRIPGVGFEVTKGGLPPGMYEESVLPTGGVTMPMDVSGFGRQDFGALAGAGVRALPLGLWSGYRDRDNGNIMLRGGRLFWYPEVAWPQVDGRSATALEHLGAVEAGYRRCQEILMEVRTELQAVGGPLHQVGAVTVRALLRSTWEYLMLLRESLAPPALLDGPAREVALAEALRTVPPWGEGADEATRMRVAWSEVDGLRSLDVPQFFSRPSSADVFDGEGRSLGELFSGTAAQRLKDRLASLDRFDIEGQSNILRYGVVSITALAGTEG